MKEKYFLGISFVLSWGIELVLILTGHTKDAMFSYLSPLIVLAPALAILVTKYAIKEPLWMNFWLKPEGRGTVKYSLIGWLAPVLLVVVGTGFYFLIFRDNFDSSMSSYIAALQEKDEALKEFNNNEIRDTLIYNILLNIPLAPFLNLFTCVGEEVSWRGYFLNMLCNKHPKWRAVLIDGIVWGIWYFPLVIGMGLFYGKDYAGYPFIGCLSTLVYCMVMGTIYSYLTIKTNSCIPAILANACVSTMTPVGSVFLKDPDRVGVFLNYMPTSIIGGIGFILTALVLMYFFIKDRIGPEPIKLPGVSNKNYSGTSMKQRMQNEHLKRNRS
ncbi:MAG: CPBP family intramembrane metalloprotease [Lachnospiraceae bacterium]|nr:CPBP family intramembrane metalloprotease [Lachnospiraceae bacterium]